jgi:Fe-S-cluster containining protein
MADNCLECGACCFSTSEDYVPVTGDDHARLGDAAEAVTRFTGNRCFMRMEASHCAALKIVGRRYVCSVYEDRPEVCRELLRGSPACQAELVLKGALARRAIG